MVQFSRSIRSHKVFFWCTSRDRGLVNLKVDDLVETGECFTVQSKD
jgi:hypothetical protein